MTSDTCAFVTAIITWAVGIFTGFTFGSMFEACRIFKNNDKDRR